MTMQEYQLLGTANSAIRRSDLVAALVEAGWSLSYSEDDENRLHKGSMRLSLEGEHTFLISVKYLGLPDDVSALLSILDKLPMSYSLDLFGDAARLVRRFIK